MKKLELNPLILILLFLLGIVGIYFIENTLAPQNYGSLLQTLLFWVAIAQGCVALVAVSDIAGGKWIQPIKKHLLSTFPIIMLVAVLFLLIFRQIDIYHWSHDQHNPWLEKWFFIFRNFALLTISFLLAWKFALESLKASEKKKIWAALFILSFVTSQSLVAFDWVMSLEYPWISTLFGGFFFIESMYSGIAAAIIIVFFSGVKLSSGDEHGNHNILRDLTNFLFGFSLFWAGMFFAQYLTIWYGNLPEEVVYISKRLDMSPVRELGQLSLLLIFFLPFISFLSKKIKTTPALSAIVGLAVLAGLFIERLVFLMPVVNIRPEYVVIEMGIILLFFVLTVLSRNRLFRDS